MHLSRLFFCKEISRLICLSIVRIFWLFFPSAIPLWFAVWSSLRWYCRSMQGQLKMWLHQAWHSSHSLCESSLNEEFMSPLRVISLELFSFSCCLFSADLDDLVSQNWVLKLIYVFASLHCSFTKKIFMKSLLFFQLPMEQLCGWGTPERLPRHCVPSLPTGRSAVTGCRALRALHGGTWRLWLLPSTILRPDALGMRPPFRPSRTRKVLREVPALHTIHSGKRVPTGRELLLHLWV